ncbi:MAG: hypothetical protein ACOYNL_00890 [Rickettsiales bacterium]
MRRLLQGAIIAAIIASGWFIVWNILMAADIARVKTSIAYHYKELRTVNRTLSLEADAVYATGFPFRFDIAVKRATLSMVDGEETFAISIPLLTMEKTDSGQGTYRVILPSTVEALYAKNGSAPENYIVSADVMPKLNLSASKEMCGPLQGKRCSDVPADAPLVSYAIGLPKSITLHMTLANESRDANFTMPSIDIPIYQPIPKDMSRPLQLFVGVLREALVFKTPTN